MGIIVLLIAISVTIALIFLGIFYWNIKSGQYDDKYTPSVRMLFDDKPRNSRNVEEVLRTKAGYNENAIPQIEDASKEDTIL